MHGPLSIIIAPRTSSSSPRPVPLYQLLVPSVLFLQALIPFMASLRPLRNGKGQPRSALGALGGLLRVLVWITTSPFLLSAMCYAHTSMDIPPPHVLEATGAYPQLPPHTLVLSETARHAGRMLRHFASLGTLHFPFWCLVFLPVHSVAGYIMFISSDNTESDRPLEETAGAAEETAKEAEVVNYQSALSEDE